MTDKLKNLTRKEIDLLPLGTRLIITWTGGNGPHVCCLVEHRHPRSNGPRVVPEFMINTNFWSTMGLNDVGEHPLTTVRVATKEEIDAERAR